ncbi:MAG: AAA family ATPase [Candidatus Omnitrophota bacterium]
MSSSKIIAVSGKGGTGKTSICALLIRAFKNKGYGPLLAVDADPNANLAEMLGLKTESSIGEICEETKKYDGGQAGMSKNDYLRFRLEQIITEAEGFDLLAMGRPEGPGCYCYANNVLRDALKILMDNYKLILIDNEAGFEHISRKTNLKIDQLLVVSDPSLRGVDTAGKIFNLAKNIGLPVEKTGLILNRVKGELSPELDKKIKDIGLGLVAKIDEDDCIADSAQTGKSIFELSEDCKSVSAVAGFCDKLLK